MKLNVDFVWMEIENSFVEGRIHAIPCLSWKWIQQMEWKNLFENEINSANEKKTTYHVSTPHKLKIMLEYHEQNWQSSIRGTLK